MSQENRRDKILEVAHPHPARETTRYDRVLGEPGRSRCATFLTSVSQLFEQLNDPAQPPPVWRRLAFGVKQHAGPPADPRLVSIIPVAIPTHFALHARQTRPRLTAGAQKSPIVKGTR